MLQQQEHPFLGIATAAVGDSGERQRVTSAPYPKNVKLLVILADFPDRSFGPGVLEEMDRKLFSDPERSVRKYYEEVSGGKMILNGHILGPVRLPYPVSHYGVNYGREVAPGIDTGVAMLVTDASRLALDQIKTFAPFCNRSTSTTYSRQVDGCVVIHAASPAEVLSSIHRDIWSQRTGSTPVSDPNGYWISKGCVFSDSSPLGVMAHELGHLLFDFPDLYSEGVASYSGSGDWCLMGSGSWLGGGILRDGSTPAHLSAWMKINQGWITPTDVVNPSSMFIRDIKETGRAIRLFPNGDTKSKEYFILEYRQKRAFDAELPGEGMLIWHINESTENNRDRNNLFINLMQADGLNHLHTDANKGDANDAYTGKNNPKFGNNTNPNSRTNSGRPTNITVSDIRPDAYRSNEINFRVRVKKEHYPSAGFAAGSPSSGYLELHGTDRDGRHYWQASPQRHVWSDRGHFDFDQGLVLKKDIRPVLLSREEGVLDLFVIGKDDQIHTAWKPDGTWHGWGSFAPLPLSDRPCLTAHSRRKDQMTLMTLGADGRVHHTEWAGSNPTYWTPWQPLSDDTFSPETPIFSLEERGSDRSFVFALKTDGVLCVSQATGGVWAPWMAVPGDKKLVPGAKPTALQTQPERIEVYILAENGACYYQFCQAGNWSGTWQRIGTASLNPRTPLAATLKEGQANLLALDGAGGVIGSWWRGDRWNDWYVPNGAVDAFVVGSGLVLISPADRQMVVFGHTRDENLYACTWQEGGWHAWEPL